MDEEFEALETENVSIEGDVDEEPRGVDEVENFEGMEEQKDKECADEIDKETNNDGDASCLATCPDSDEDEDPLNGYEAQEAVDDGHGALTSWVGTRWFKCPELLYGSSSYGLEIDLWALGCIFAELFTLEPLFSGVSDIDQLSRIFNVLGNLTEQVWPGCVELPDYKTISFNTVEKPIGLESCLPNRSADEIALVKRLVCYDPASRSTAMELLDDKYFREEPPPVPISELQVPLSKSFHDDHSSGGWYDDMGSDSDFEEFGSLNVTKTDSGFSIQFP